MSSTEASAAAPFRARLQTLRVACCVSLLMALPAGAATLGKTYFFATRDACVGSGAFSARECAAAFANARAQLRDLSPRFAGSGECRLHFRICELSRDETPVEDAISYAPDERPAYVPAALGVEMIAAANGVQAAPTLAIETPTRLFPYYPVSKSYRAEPKAESVQARNEAQNAAILSPDHFEPFSRRKPVAGATTFTASALGAIEGAVSDFRGETREERQMRLRNAPFIE